MVWIHGGGWQSGSSTTDLYGPDYLVEENVILVTINYRLGVYGFLSLDDSTLDVPGNQAFKDQRMALKWVQVRMIHLVIHQVVKFYYIFYQLKIIIIK